MCTVNKSVHTKKVWKLIECTSYILMLNLCNFPIRTAKKTLTALTDSWLGRERILVMNKPAAEKAYSASTEFAGMFSKAL